MNLEKVVVFIFFEWSGQARFSKRIINDWESQSKIEIPVFEINPEDSELLSKWVSDEVKDGYGYGSVVWLEKGKILNFEKDAGKSGVSEIENKTSAIFGS